jgi:hypothetical protein
VLHLFDKHLVKLEDCLIHDLSGFKRAPPLMMVMCSRLAALFGLFDLFFFGFKLDIDLLAHLDHFV